MRDDARSRLAERVRECMPSQDVSYTAQVCKNISQRCKSRPVNPMAVAQVFCAGCRTSKFTLPHPSALPHRSVRGFACHASDKLYACKH